MSVSKPSGSGAKARRGAAVEVDRVAFGVAVERRGRDLRRLLPGVGAWRVKESGPAQAVGRVRKASGGQFDRLADRVFAPGRRPVRPRSGSCRAGRRGRRPRGCPRARASSAVEVEALGDVGRRRGRASRSRRRRCGCRRRRRAASRRGRRRAGRRRPAAGSRLKRPKRRVCRRRGWSRPRPCRPGCRRGSSPPSGLLRRGRCAGCGSRPGVHLSQGAGVERSAPAAGRCGGRAGPRRGRAPGLALEFPALVEADAEVELVGVGAGLGRRLRRRRRRRWPRSRWCPARKPKPWVVVKVGRRCRSWCPRSWSRPGGSGRWCSGVRPEIAARAGRGSVPSPGR